MGWVILSAEGAVEDHLSSRQLAFLERIGARLVCFGDGGHRIRDIDRRYQKYLAELGAAILVIRPDFYLFAAAASMFSNHAGATP